jgi:Pyruvate/2-oxoacid:ferredoxin oxidoreductase delta subunit
MGYLSEDGNLAIDLCKSCGVCADTVTADELDSNLEMLAGDF